MIILLAQKRREGVPKYLEQEIEFTKNNGHGMIERREVLERQLKRKSRPRSKQRLAQQPPRSFTYLQVIRKQRQSGKFQELIFHSKTIFEASLMD